MTMTKELERRIKLKRQHIEIIKKEIADLKEEIKRLNAQ